jgi:hypothetical protein
MRSRSLRCAILIAVLSLLASCGGGGGGGGSDTPVCTQTGNMTLYTSSAGTMLLTSVTVTAVQGDPVPDVPVFVGYMSPPVAAIVAGYPVGSTDPRSFGIGIVAAGAWPDNPLQFSITFDANRAAATYQGTWRFVVTDAVPRVVGCQDLPVTFTVN